MTGLFNIIALFCIVTIPDLRIEKPNLFIASLILANVLTGLNLAVLYAPFDPAHSSDKRCRYMTALTVFTISASCLSRSTIAIDRYNYICHPLHYQNKTSGIYIATMLFILWGTSLALAMSSYFYYQTDLKRDHDDICLPFTRCLYNMSTLLVLIVLSSLIITYVYSKIFYWAHLQIQLLKQETIMRAQRRSSSLQGYFKSAWKLRRITRATDMLISPKIGRDSESSFTLELETDAINEVETKKLKHFTAPSAEREVKMFRNIPNRLMLSINSRGTSVDESTRSSSIVSKETDDLKMNAMKVPSSSPVEGNVMEPDMKKEAQEHKMLVNALEHRRVSSSQDSSVSITEKWYQHELKRYTGQIYNSLFLSASDRRFSQQSTLMINMLKRTEVKALIIVFITFGAHLVCWLPYILYSLTAMRLKFPFTKEQELLILLIGFSCSVLDPLIYCLLNQPFRKTVVTYFRNCWRSMEM
ncbi:histamine H2 receptor [Biomphalaria pfeifferi]|uniref:Histamine H2 receptor n=1 Tax=Biomphalaria pfeifferi TaxID=112525 RepID=A0AAD8AR85_BIOPF|nr:histamine H2 receptor [Biomphalaria pfeifferi]